jgi:hypothetical protein
VFAYRPAPGLSSFLGFVLVALSRSLLLCTAPLLCTNIHFPVLLLSRRMVIPVSHLGFLLIVRIPFMIGREAWVPFLQSNLEETAINTSSSSRLSPRRSDSYGDVRTMVSRVSAGIRARLFSVREAYLRAMRRVQSSRFHMNNHLIYVLSFRRCVGDGFSGPSYRNMLPVGLDRIHLKEHEFLSLQASKGHML